MQLCTTPAFGGGGAILFCMIVPASPENIERASRLISSGDIVAFPTETVYGLGANALDPAAVVKIFEAKHRPLFDPLIVHVANMDMARTVARVDTEIVQRLARAFWPGPLTLIMPKTALIPDIVTAGFSTVAVRMPDHPVALELVKQAKVPIAAPSANAFGKLSPTTASHVEEQLGNAVSMILDGGASAVGVESTILDVTRSVPTIVRAGGLAAEDIERVVGTIDIDCSASERPDAPGKLKHHYAPRTARLQLLEHAWPVQRIVLSSEKRYGLLAFGTPRGAEGFAEVQVLPRDALFEQAAARLFEALHALDRAQLDVIFAEPVPEIGLGRAIMDRLRRASANDDEML